MDIDDYKIQARQMMQPLPGYTPAQWSSIDPEKKKRLIIADMKKQVKGPPAFKNPVSNRVEMLGKNQKGQTVIREKSVMSELFEKADEMQKKKKK